MVDFCIFRDGEFFFVAVYNQGGDLYTTIYKQKSPAVARLFYL